MKLIYLGTDVYLPLFKYFVENHEVIALYTYHNDEDYFYEYEIVKYAKENGIKVHYEPLSEEQIKNYFLIDKIDFLICAEYAHILSIPENIENYKGINVHGSLLPQGRGYYPIESAKFYGIEYTGVTMHKLVSKVDQGDIIFQEKIKINDDVDSVDIYLKASNIMEKNIERIMDNFEYYWNSASKQLTKEPYWKRPDNKYVIITSDMTLCEAKKIYENFNRISEVEIEDKLYRIKCLEASKTCIDRIIKVEDDLYLYPVKDGHLRIVVQERK